MAGPRVVSRAITILAIAVLAFDGAALTALGFMTGRIVLVPIGLVFLLASALVVVYWQWHLEGSRRSPRRGRP